MSDRFPAQIWIGGKISRTAKLYPDDPDDNTTILQGLVGALSADGASHEYGDRPIDSNFDASLELAGYTDEGLLHLKQDQAVNGEFSDTEEFCIEHDIPFDRWSDHYCECDAENVYWRPGMNSVVFRYSDAQGNEIVCGDTVRQVMAEFEACKTRIPGTMKPDRFEAGLKLLHDACPELPPDLEKFEIVA